MNTENSKAKIQKAELKKAVFLDRDGTICEDAHYLSRVEELKIFPFAAEAIKLLNDNGFPVILITNQSGIARGFFDEKVLLEIHEKLITELAKAGAKLDAIYFCPHNAENDCSCRKPQIGMIERAMKDFPLDLKNSWMIGDKAIDVEMGFNAKTKTALVLTGYGTKDREKLSRSPDLITENILEAVKSIVLNN